MLPTHAPLVIAEQFGTLAALFPDRIDLGLGRAPGGDPAVTHALRRNLSGDVDQFPRDVLELQGYFRPTAPGQAVQAVPGAGLEVPLWLLGSSTFGAQLAARLGLPFAFASHFAPAELERAVALYRTHFRPSEQLGAPYVMLGVNVFAADTDAQARLLFTSLQQSYVNLRTGRPSLLPPPQEGYADRLPPERRAILDHVLPCSIVGSPETVRAGLAAFAARTGADELMVTAQIHDHRARLRSFEILAQAHASL
jgi:luciferase family oxidoreductase group 1